MVLLRNTLPSSLVYVKGSEIEGVPEAVDALKRMFQAAANDGITDWQISAGYRSYAYQQQLFDNSVDTLIAEGRSRESAISVTRLTVADPGTSEHQLGLAFDITVADTIFKGTPQQLWLAANCWGLRLHRPLPGRQGGYHRLPRRGLAHPLRRPPPRHYHARQQLVPGGVYRGEYAVVIFLPTYTSHLRLLIQKITKILLIKARYS